MDTACRDRMVTEKAPEFWELERWEGITVAGVVLFLFHLQHLSNSKLALGFPQGSLWDLGRSADISIFLEFRKKEKCTI